MKINSLPNDPGPAGWDAILPPRRPGPALEIAKTADWLIIGAGFAGLSAARRLRQLHPTDRVVILEARALCQGPVARNSGFMIDLPHVLSSNSYSGAAADDRAQITANRAAIAFARQTVEDYELPAEAFDPMGKINGAMTEDASLKSKEYAKHLENLGEDSSFLDAKAMRDLTGTSAYVSGLHTPGTIVLQPALYARGWSNGLKRDRVELFENSPVSSLSREGGDWVATTPNGKVTAPRVILGVNGQIERFGHFKRRLLHVYLYASLTRAFSDEDLKTLGGTTKWGITPADPMGSTVRRISGTGGDRIAIRNGITYDPNLRGEEKHIARTRRAHIQGLTKRFPHLGARDIEFSWGGALCLSQNDTPAFGEIEPGLFAAACQNGLGTTHGTLAGMLSADLASGEKSDLLTWQLTRPDPTKLSAFADLGAPPVLKWKEFKARREI